MDASQKTLSVLDALGDGNNGDRLADIAARAGVPKPTVHRILQRLIEAGYARAEGDGRYAPGPRILALAGEMLHGLDPGHYLGPVLRELHDEVGHTVHFALRAGDEAVYVEKLEHADAAYHTASRVGGRLPLYCTAIGKALLAAMPAAEAGEVLGRVELDPRTERTLATAAALEAELATVRERGFALDDEENERNIRCIGAAVFDNRDRPVGAVSVSTLAFELDRDGVLELGPRVVAAAQDLSAALGAPRTDARADRRPRAGVSAPTPSPRPPASAR
jgi:IclR family acetate operon transcriptional repressor